MTAEPKPKPRHRRWKTALLVLGSATFGGIAFALWNRRELAQMQAQRNVPTKETSEELEEDVL